MNALMKWLHFAWLNALRNKRRSAVTLSIAALGTAGLLLAGGFALFTYESLAQSAARTTGHLVLGTPAQFSQDEDTPLQHGLDDWQALRRTVLAEPEVRQVLPRVEFTGLISNGEKSTVMMANGIDADAEFAVKGPFLQVKSGEVIMSRERQVVMLGEGLAKSLKAEPGSSLTLLASTTAGALNAVDVTVRGVVSTGIAELDKRLVYLDLPSAQALLGTERVSTLGVFLKDMASTAPVQQRLQATHGALKVKTWLDLATFYQAVRDLYNRIFGALGLIIALIVLFVVANAMAMAIIERTREIGTLRALGTTPRQLLTTLSLEGLVLGGGGAVLGALLALGISLFLLVVPVMMPPPPGSTKGYPLNIAIDGSLYAWTLLAMVLLTGISSALVARRTVHQPVVDALAHV